MGGATGWVPQTSCVGGVVGRAVQEGARQKPVQRTLSKRRDPLNEPSPTMSPSLWGTPVPLS